PRLRRLLSAPRFGGGPGRPAQGGLAPAVRPLRRDRRPRSRPPDPGRDPPPPRSPLLLRRRQPGLPRRLLVRPRGGRHLPAVDGARGSPARRPRQRGGHLRRPAGGADPVGPLGVTPLLLLSLLASPPDTLVVGITSDPVS